MGKSLGIFVADLDIGKPGVLSGKLLYGRISCRMKSRAGQKSRACFLGLQLLSIPPYTPEMNPIEQIWKQIRSMGFRNEVFNSLDDVMNRLCETICMVTNDMIKSITGRK